MPEITQRPPSYQDLPVVKSPHCSMAAITQRPSAYRDPTVGDLIIRTADQVEFHVHQRRLADVLPVFSDMLSLPRPPTSGDDTVPDKPVVDVTESSAVWDKLLPLVYNDEEPHFGLADIREVFEACTKYQAPGVRSRMRTHLFRPEFLDENPFTVYALACCGGFEDVASAAAKRTLHLPVYPADVPEYSLISGRALFRLLEYREHCGEAASAVVTIESSNQLTSESSWLVHDRTKSWAYAYSCNCRKSAYLYNRDGPDILIRKYWLDYLHQLKETVTTTPCGDVACSSSSLKPVFNPSRVRCDCSKGEIGVEAVEFSSQVKAKIDEAVSKVQLVFEP